MAAPLQLIQLSCVVSANYKNLYQYKDKYVSRSNIYWFETTDKALVDEMFKEQKISSLKLNEKNRISFHSSIDKIKDTIV